MTTRRRAARDDTLRRIDHVDLHTLQLAVDGIRQSPSDGGRVELIARRPMPEQREVLSEGRLDPVVGLLGDRWSTEARNPDTQLTLMNARSAAAIAGPAKRWALAGDQLYVDLDLSGANLPPGTRLAVGTALIEITDIPHRGCGKFVARFGVSASTFVNSPVGRELNLRGVNAKVLRGGVVRPGDAIGKAA